MQYLDEEYFEYKYFDKSDFPKVIEKIEFAKLNFIFDLENPENEDDGYSLARFMPACLATCSRSDNSDPIKR